MRLQKGFVYDFRHPRHEKQIISIALGFTFISTSVLLLSHTYAERSS